MKLGKGFFAILISIIIIVSSTLIVLLIPQNDDNNNFIGCGGDPHPPFLYVKNYSRGYDDEWLKALADRFEEEYKNVSFDDTLSKGVRVIIDTPEDDDDMDSHYIPGSRYHVYFTDDSDYYKLVNAEYLADITDIVTEDLGSFGEEGVTIEDKLSTQHKNFYKTNEKYYAIPHHSSYFGITYNVDVFDKYGFYFIADPNVDASTTPYNTIQTNIYDSFNFGKDVAKSNGPDGKPNTYDDGLPATYDEFFMLCDYIQQGWRYTPVIWSGEKRNEYIQMLCQALATDYEGAEQMMLNYTFNGTATTLIKSIDENGKIEFNEPTTITNENGYEMLKSAGRYYALDFFQRLSSNEKYYHSFSYDPNRNPSNAHDELLYTPFDAVSCPIAMLIDNSWWEDQSTDTANHIASIIAGDWDKKDRRFAMMPLPKATKEQIGEPFTTFNSHNSISFINANCSPIEMNMAKAFLQFANTQESLVEFTLTTNTPKALNYELTNDQINEMTYFGKSLWSIKESGNVVYPLSTNEFFKDNQSALNYCNFFQADISDKTYNSVADDLRGTNASRVSAKDFFNGIIAKYDSIWWNDTFGEWFQNKENA